MGGVPDLELLLQVLVPDRLLDAPQRGVTSFTLPANVAAVGYARPQAAVVVDPVPRERASGPAPPTWDVLSATVMGTSNGQPAALDSSSAGAVTSG